MSQHTHTDSDGDEDERHDVRVRGYGMDTLNSGFADVQWEDYVKAVEDLVNLLRLPVENEAHRVLLNEYERSLTAPLRNAFAHQTAHIRSGLESRVVDACDKILDDDRVDGNGKPWKEYFDYIFSGKAVSLSEIS